ncbi:MAG: HEAT repeat domain-containing protein [Candidatus Marinimicrobia bacterium]|jgi:HEAT repeat protein|nr:HEAT repeat domain-containing protein [Candidatus Neomarinimicrobiota bacterium]
MSKSLNQESNPSKVYVMFYSFFLIPLMIAVIGTSFFIIVKFLTMEPKSASDLLNDVKIGSASKRWQSAFELSKILANETDSVDDVLFRNQLVTAYSRSVHDDERVRMYLALAMGQTGDQFYGKTLRTGLKDDNPVTRLAAIKALGVLQYTPAVEELREIITDQNREDVEYLTAVVSLGNMGDQSVIPDLIPLLDHEEVNIRWDTAVSLAKLGDTSGLDIIADLMDRTYYYSYPEVDQEEANQAIRVAIHVSSEFRNDVFKEKLVTLAEGDENMEIRDTAIKALKQIYGHPS